MVGCSGGMHGSVLLWWDGMPLWWDVVVVGCCEDAMVGCRGDAVVGCHHGGMQWWDAVVASFCAEVQL